MIPTALAVVFFITTGIAFLIGHVEGRNKGHDLEESAFNAGHRQGWKEGSGRFAGGLVTDEQYDYERQFRGPRWGLPIETRI